MTGGSAFGGRVQVFRPFPAAPGVVFGRAAARSGQFEPSAAAGGQRVMIGSAAGSDPADVELRARNELIERVSNVLAGRRREAAPTTTATYDELHAAGRLAIEPGDRRDDPMLWVSGEGLVSGEEILVPAGAAFLHHRPPPGCAVGPNAGSTGVSAHGSRDAATDHALLEVLERDLFWRSWYVGGGEGRRVAVLPLPTALEAALADLGLGTRGLVVDGPGSTGLAVACLYAHERSRQSFGSRAFLAGGEPLAFERAVYEALMVRWSMGTPAARDAWAAMQARGDSSPRDALEHALIAFQGGDALSWWLGRCGDGRPAGSRRMTPGLTGEVAGGFTGSLARLLAGHFGAEPVAVDSTVPEVCGDEVVVVRVVAPGAHRLPGDERLAHAPAAPPHPLG